MKPASFAYHRAASVGEALELLAREGEDAKVIAGGQSLVPLMAFRLARPSALIDINRIAELRYVRRDGDALRIGALATHRDIETNAEPGVLEGYSILPRAARFIGHYPIRTRGTFGGSIAHADPTSEWCMLALLLDAEIVVDRRAGLADRRRLGLLPRGVHDRARRRRGGDRGQVPRARAAIGDPRVRAAAGGLRGRRRRDRRSRWRTGACGRRGSRSRG